MKSNADRNQDSSERRTASHTIDGDGTTPADATVRLRDPTVAQTLRGSAGPHACDGCGRRFYRIGNLLEHDFEEDFGGPDPENGQTPTAGGDA